MKTKLIVSLTLLSLVIAACGGQATQTTPEPAVPTEAQSQPTESPTSTAVPPTEAVATEASAPATEASTPGVSFASDVKPILAGSCNDCHGGRQTRAGLDVTTYEGLMAGSINGAVVVPGNSSESVLIQQVVEGEMPKRGDKLTSEQIQIINDWVAAGALNN